MANATLTLTLTLTAEQLDLMLAMARDVGEASSKLARAEHTHSTSRDKRRTYREMSAARKWLARCELALENMRRRVGAEPR